MRQILRFYTFPASCILEAKAKEGAVQREPSFLTTGEIAKCCQVSHLTVSNWIRAGKLRASHTPGGHARVQREDFLPFLVEHNFPIPEAFGRERKRILVVDDEQALAEAIAQVLQKEGYQVSVAFDGYAAGVKMATVQPDLLVLDLIIPGVDGFSVCKRVKADPATRRTKILAMTGFVQEGNVPKALECGADLCLEKPFGMESLKAAVARLLGQRKGNPSGDLGIERRRSLRIAAEFPVNCTWLSGGGTATGAPQCGRSINLSREGIRLALGGPLEPFSPVALEIFLPESREPIRARGEGRWVESRQGTQDQDIGIEFIGIQAQERRRLIKRLYTS